MGSFICFQGQIGRLSSKQLGETPLADPDIDTVGSDIDPAEQRHQNRPCLVWRQRSELIGDMAGATNQSGLLDGIGTLILDDIEERAAIGEKGLEPGDY